MAERKIFFYGEMESPLGPLTLLSSEIGICLIEFGAIQRTLPAIKAWMKKHSLCNPLVHDQDRLQPVVIQLEQYFNGKRFEFTVPIDLIGTKFQCVVWEKLKEIGYGETKTYKEIAQEIGSPKAVRAIGGANNKNPIPIIIPCHRVIGSNGALVGYGGGLDKKETLLQIESSVKKIS